MVELTDKSRVKIECPVCRSGNRFQLTEPLGALVCEDCGFELVVPDRTNSGCIFCGCDQFYLERPFGLPIFAQRTVCYLCEAEYRDVSLPMPALSFDQQLADAVAQSSIGIEWAVRAREWN